MVPLLTDRSFHPFKLWASQTQDKICALFFKTLSRFNSRYEEYHFYFAHRAERRIEALTSYPNEIVQISSNQLYPGKKSTVTQPEITKPEVYEYKKETVANRITELCVGVCSDHMRRVKTSPQDFWITIRNLAVKFKDGSSKKGYVLQNNYNQISLTENYRKNSPVKTLKKIVKTDDREKILETWNKYKNKILDDCKFNIFSAKLINFTAQNYTCKPYKNDLENYEQIPCGDYLLEQQTLDNRGHVVCLYKREEGTVVFDPNCGTLFFKDHEHLLEYVKTTKTRHFGEQPTVLSLFQCKDKEVTP